MWYQDYIELRHHMDGRRLLFRINSIKDIEEINGSCRVNGLVVQESYDQVKQMLKQDARRFICDHEIDFRVRHLKMLTVREIARRLSGEEALEFIRKLVFSADEEEVFKLIESKLPYERQG